VAITGGFVDRLLQGRAGELNQKQTEYLKTIKKEITRLEQYIFSFLDIARIESGQLQLQIASCDLEHLVREIVQAHEVQAGEKGIELQLDLADLSGPVGLDRLQMTRVISNLLDNAIKYSPAKSRVRISLTQKGGEVILAVHDQGPGIALPDQAHIFDHFYRVDNQRRSVKGTGLGLAAVKAIVEAHGGRVWLKSSPGKGSSFFVALPVGR
jgi:signal transduction histidine kinase